jgi:hypothetical protein
MMITYKELAEAKSSTVVMAFGRMSPPTSGHELLVKAVLATAKKNNAEHIIFLSRTQDAKKNPLTVDQKVYYARQSFKGANIVGASDQIRTFIEAAKYLTGKYKNLIMVAGSDRLLEYKQLLDKYNGKDFKFDSVLVVSAGERDPDADGASGMSATKMRQAAADNDFAKFKQGVPTGMNLATAKKMFDDVRAGMKLNEDSNDVREDYVNNRIFGVGSIVSYNNEEKAVVWCGPNYVVLEGNEKAWIKDIAPTGKVDEAIMVKQQDKLKAARIIGMALGYEDAEIKTDPAQIVNSALRGIRNKAMNPEMKKILTRMLELATKMEIKYDDKLINLKEAFIDEISDRTLKSYTKKAMQDTLSGKKDRNKGMQKAYSKLAGTDKPLGESQNDATIDDEEAEAHALMTKQGKASETKYKQLRKIHLKMHESDEEDGEDLSDEELEKLANDLSDDDMIEHGYDDDELHVVDEETGEEIIDEEVDALHEVLSRVERMRAKVRMARTKAKRQRNARIALKRRSTTPVVANRARRLAIKALKMKFARKPLNKLSVAEKERLELRISKLKPIITRLATKIMPKVRQLEKNRLEHSSTKG